MGKTVVERCRDLFVAVVAGAVVVTSGAVSAPSASAAPAQPSDASALRIGVLALVASISAVGQTPELATPLPFTTTSLADLLDLDRSLTENIDQALQGADLEAALGSIDGITVLNDTDPSTIAFTYDRTVSSPLELVHDDGDLRFGANDGAGKATVSLTTRDDAPFVVAVDPDQTDPLLRVALVSQPLFDLSVDIDTDAVKPFMARQGFTAVAVKAGHYRVHRDQVVAMRDPDGRGLLTLEDLRYSTLPDLFRVTTQKNVLDISLDVALPDSLAGGAAAERTGTLSLQRSGQPDADVWPTAADAVRTYGSKLAEATGLSMVDGLTSLAQYTGSVLALQDAAEVPFPNLDGGTSDLFAPGDELLSLLATAASAQVICGPSPGTPPTGVAAPGDTVYCQATTAGGLGAISGVTWTLNDAGSVVEGGTDADTVGQSPTSLVKVTGSDGEPDLTVAFTADQEPLTARSMPRTVQDVVNRVGNLSGSTASATLTQGRLDVAIGIREATTEASLPLGNAGTLGALVGLTGLRAPDVVTTASGVTTKTSITARTTAGGASFDVGFGVQTGTPAPGQARQTFLLPSDTSLLEIDDVSATTPPSLKDLPARIGFLGVKADVTGLDLGHTAGSPAMTLDRVPVGAAKATDPLPIDDLFGADGALDPDQLRLRSALTASIDFTATEQAVSPGTYATGNAGPATGAVSVRWSPSGLPSVTEGAGYAPLRVFDPVPARFLTGTATVTPGTGTGAASTPDTVTLDVTSLPTGQTLYEALNVAPPAGSGKVEVLRRLQADGLGCQTVSLLDAQTLTCGGLAPAGKATLASGATVQVVVLGDPFALRDSVIEGLAATLSEVDRIDGDHVTEAPLVTADQYTSTLPLVGLTPAQLAVERDALREGLAAIDTAATEDESGISDTPVSTAQELSGSVDQLVAVGGSNGDYDPSLDLTLDKDHLGVALVAHAPSGTELKAPLRLDDVGTATVPGRGQVSSGSSATVPVGVASTTTLAITVDRLTARPAIAGLSGTDSTATLSRTGNQLSNHPLAAGVAALTVQDGSTADLGVTVRTQYVAGTFETRRTNAQGSGDAARAQLVVGPDDTIRYAAKATDSSGGAGAVQPAPDPMQVRFLAEGLDGLSSALASALDGAALSNLDPATGAPVSAPLIGTNLDAGAGVPDILTDLTSQLRTQLALPVVTGAKNAVSLSDALDDAVVNGVKNTPGLSGITTSDVTVVVRCGGTAGACTPCPTATPTPTTSAVPSTAPTTTAAPTSTPTVTPTTTAAATTTATTTANATATTATATATAPTTAKPCTTETATGWDTVTISTTLTGLEKKDGKATFETGLDGLEVRSDQDVTTATSWTLPVTLQLKRGVGPQVVVGPDDALELKVDASLPSGGIDAIVGYLPAHLTGSGTGRDGAIDTTVVVKPTAATYDLFDLYQGGLRATAGFTGAGETGLSLGFDTLAQDKGVLGLSGHIDFPWTAQDGFGDVNYDDVVLDIGKVASTIATPFQVVDPYLAPVRDVVDVLRSPIPVVSDLSELGGGGEVSLLSLLETLAKAKKKPQLELAYRVITLVGGVSNVIHDLAPLANEKVSLDDVGAAASLITVSPSEVELHSKCTQAITTVTTTPGTAKTVHKKAPEPCPSGDELESDQGTEGAAGQTAADNRKGKRHVHERIDEKTRSITGSLPGFSLPFLAEPDQIMDMLTGEGEASYFRLDLGTLAAQVAYRQTFGPIMAGPIPIQPFVGGSITLEGRLAMGFDSMPQTQAAQAVNPGDVTSLLAAYEKFDAGNVLREGFYIDDLDAEGVDVPEVKLVTTLQAGAGVSIGIVTAGLKGSVTLTINLDLNDPNDDGRLRTAEIRDVFSGKAACVFDASAEIEAAIAVYVEIELLFTSLEYEYDILRLGPYELFKYGCPDAVPTLVTRGTGSELVLTSGRLSSERIKNAVDVADDYEVRQFAKDNGRTTYEISGFGRVQNVDVVASGPEWTVTIYEAGLTTSTKEQASFTTQVPPTFAADGGAGDDTLAFLAGEEFDGNVLVPTPFTTQVTALTGGDGADVLTTGDADDTGIDGGAGNDSINTGPGDDQADGGAGNDTISGGSGRDDLLGGADDDRVQGGPGADRVSGEAGNDSLVGGTGRDVRSLLVQPRRTTSAVVADQVRLGFDSGDVLVGGTGVDSVDGGDGSDVVVGGSAPTLTTPAIDSLFTTGQRTVNVLVQGTTVDDDAVITTQDVAITTARVPDDATLDTLCVSGTPTTGAGGEDFVSGGAEKDVVVGSDGADVLDGGAGPDEICGRAGDDQISGDSAVAATSTDGSADRDIIRGGTGNDRADGGPGNDVMFGDDVALVRNGVRVLDGSLGSGGVGAGGKDYLDGGTGDDVLAGGAGADLLLGSLGNDATFGEGRDTVAVAGVAPPVSQRLLACNLVTRVVRGRIDLDGDLLAGAGGGGIAPDTGRLAGINVVDGEIRAGSAAFEGLISGEVAVIDGRVDLDRDGDAVDDVDDTGIITLPSMIDDPTNPEGDCVLAGDGNDQLGGGAGSDYLGAGDGTDLVDGGDGNDLLLGDVGTDVLLGGPHHDVLVGGTGDDALVGGDGDDRLRGNEGDDDLVGGSDTSGASDGQDVLLGGGGQDVLVAENGIAVSESVVAAVADPSVPWRSTTSTPAAVTAVTGSPLVFASSALDCNSQPATRWLTMLADDGTAGVPVASPGTAPAYDELYGGDDCDVVLGSAGDDLVRGGPGGDIVEAGPGSDVASGDDGDDVVVGGSSFDPTRRTRFTTDRDGAGVPDGADVVRGDGGPDGLDGSDLLAGDNALPVRVADPSGPGGVGPSYVLQLHDVATTTSSPSPTTSGGDQLSGDGSGDRIFGQGGDDTLAGRDGQDYLEGNDGADTLTGGDGDDDLLGGSSAVDGLPLGSTGTRLSDSLGAALDSSAAGLLDRGSDVIDAGAGADVVLGDNGRITRPDPVRREIARADETSSTDVSGADVINGGDDADRLFGEGGDDSIDAGSADDHVEGNEGADVLVGGLDSDVVIGGSSLSPDNRGTLDDAVANARTQLDGSDTIQGDLTTPGPVSPDLLVGDNATVLESGGAGGVRVVQLADVATTSSVPAALTSGDDVISGGTAAAGLAAVADRVFGQGGDDVIRTGAADDYVEGADGDDLVFSGDGDDDVLGGSSATDGRPLGDTGNRLTQDGEGPPAASAVRLIDGADSIDAGGGDDVVLGDNGLLTRPAGAGTPTRGDGTRLRTVQLYDVVTASVAVPTGVGGADRVAAGAGRDLVFGQAGDDVVAGDGDGDYLEGNVGADTLGGGSGEDDLVGGGSSTSGAVITVSGTDVEDRLLTPVSAATDPTAAGQVDGNDVLDGGDSRDVLLGDNGRITRDGPGRVLSGGGSGPHLVRQVAMADEGPGVWAGSDQLYGGLGDDDLYGQFDSTLTRRAKQTFQGQRVPGDVLDGGAGDDALLGDQGVDVPTPAAALGATGRTVRDKNRFLRERVRPTGTLVRVVTLSQSTRGGDDVLLGGDGRDSLHAGAGKDLSNAGAGGDVVFAGSGSDALWGGTGHDLLLGGAGSDVLDIKRRARDPQLWRLVAPTEDTDRLRRTVNGRDVLYGGSGADGLQADQGDEGTSRRAQGDRLVDWRGPINGYQVCRSGYGPGKVLNSASSSLISTLRLLAAATGSVGSAELAIPGSERLVPYRDSRRFVCETR